MLTFHNLTLIVIYANVGGMIHFLKETFTPEMWMIKLFGYIVLEFILFIFLGFWSFLIMALLLLIVYSD